MPGKHRHLQPLADALKRGERVTILSGAGTSTSAGIPDFRSPETGLYANLARLKLPYAEAVFDIDYFRENPFPFYALADELYPGKFCPTKFHHFIRLLQDKGLLHRVYTQNIDTLERRAGVHDEFIVEAHGSFALNHCIECEKEMSNTDLLILMKKTDTHDGIPRCKLCAGLVKPDIVFFGEGLPERFFLTWEQDRDVVKVAVVAGTSLTVQPFAGLPSELPRSCLRVLANLEVVGDFKRKRKRDIVYKQECDVFANDICELMGWTEELDNLVSAYTSDDKMPQEGSVKAVPDATGNTLEDAVCEENEETPGEAVISQIQADIQELFVRDDDLSTSDDDDGFATASSGEAEAFDKKPSRQTHEPDLTEAVAALKLQ